MCKRTTKLIVCLILTFTFIVATVSASEVNIKKTEIIYGPEGVNIIYKYNLDPVQTVKGYLFGAKYIEEDITGFFNNSEDLRINKIDFREAILTFPVRHINGTNYFPGVELTKNIDNVVLIFPGNSTITLNNTSQIPAAFYSNNY